MATLHLGGPCATSERTVERSDLAAAAAELQIPDVSTVVAGRQGTAIRLAALVGLAGVNDRARFVHVESDDGEFTANLDFAQATSQGLIIYEHDGSELPRAKGGPYRLLLQDGDDCSVNVKFLGRVEFLESPGTHTAACAD